MSRLSVAASRRLVLGGLASLPLAAAFGAPARADRSGADLILIAMADLHSPYRALPALVRAVKDVAAAAPGVPMAILINGDVFERGNAVAKNSEGMVDWAFLGTLASVAPLVINIGNHEVALRDDLATFVTGAQRLGARVIGNVMDNRTGGFYAPVSTRFSLGDHKIGVLGLAPSDPMVWREAARTPLGLMDPVAFAGSAMPSAFGGVDLPVVLSHAGLAPDKLILRALPANSLMIGGHDHLALEHQENGSLYLHSGCWGESIHAIAVTFEDGVPKMEFETIVIDPDGPTDRSVKSIVTAATLAFLPTEAREVIATLPKALDRAGSILFAADAVRRAAGADIALLNHSAFGATLGKGLVRVYELDNFVRFDGAVMMAQVDADTLTAMLSHANQGDRAALDTRSGDYVHARDLVPEAGRMYRVAVSDWVAGRQQTYLGTEGVDFAPVPDVAIRSSVEAALRGRA